MISLQKAFILFKKGMHVLNYSANTEFRLMGICARPQLDARRGHDFFGHVPAFCSHLPYDW